jgi:hypothetical protein
MGSVTLQGAWVDCPETQVRAEGPGPSNNTRVTTLTSMAAGAPGPLSARCPERRRVLFCFVSCERTF